MTTIVELKLNLSEALNKQLDAQAGVEKAIQEIKSHVQAVIEESKCGIVSQEGALRWTIDWAQ